MQILSFCEKGKISVQYYAEGVALLLWEPPKNLSTLPESPSEVYAEAAGAALNSLSNSVDESLLSHHGLIFKSWARFTERWLTAASSNDEVRGKSRAINCHAISSESNAQAVGRHYQVKYSESEVSSNAFIHCCSVFQQKRLHKINIP